MFPERVLRSYIQSSVENLGVLDASDLPQLVDQDLALASEKIGQRETTVRREIY